MPPEGLTRNVALAAVSRWDDENRIRLARTLPAALLGAVDGGGVPAAHALVLDHLVEDNLPRLQYLLAVIDRLRQGAAGIPAARVALNRAAAWIRCDVSARARRRSQGASSAGPPSVASTDTSGRPWTRSSSLPATTRTVLSGGAALIRPPKRRRFSPSRRAADGRHSPTTPRCSRRRR